VGMRLDDFGGFWICKVGDIMIVLYWNVCLTRNELRE
jgi:hypothetical protein